MIILPHPALAQAEVSHCFAVTAKLLRDLRGPSDEEVPSVRISGYTRL